MGETCKETTITLSELAYWKNLLTCRTKTLRKRAERAEAERDHYLAVCNQLAAMLPIVTENELDEMLGNGSCSTCNAPTDAFNNCLGSCAGEEWERPNE